jgi:hypothetical protein
LEKVTSTIEIEKEKVDLAPADLGNQSGYPGEEISEGVFAPAPETGFMA